MVAGLEFEERDIALEEDGPEPNSESAWKLKK